MIILLLWAASVLLFYRRYSQQFDIRKIYTDMRFHTKNYLFLCLYLCLFLFLSVPLSLSLFFSLSISLYLSLYFFLSISSWFSLSFFFLWLLSLSVAFLSPFISFCISVFLYFLSLRSLSLPLSSLPLSTLSSLYNFKNVKYFLNNKIFQWKALNKFIRYRYFINLKILINKSNMNINFVSYINYVHRLKTSFLLSINWIIFPLVRVTGQCILYTNL